MNHKLTKFIIIVFIILSGIETCSYITVAYLQKKGGFYRPPRIQLSEYEDYFKKRDKLLGWSMLNYDFKAALLDKAGSRFTPVFPDPDRYPAFVSLYGDSYIYGAGVTDEYAFGNVLSGLLNRRVSNYGVVGYGTDQAYLKFHENINDNAQIVILGYLTENILRNVNRYRLLLYSAHGEKFCLKPRFILNNNEELKLIPIPNLTYKEFLDLVNFPEKYLRGEYFIPGGQAGVFKAKFPFAISLWNVVTKNFHFKAKIKSVPWYKEFYEYNHPSNALMTTVAIINDFSFEARKRHARPILLIIPTCLDFKYYKKHKEWPYKNLLYKLSERRIEFIDAGTYMIRAYSDDIDPLRWFDTTRAHYNTKGYKILAEVAYQYFLNNNLLNSDG